MGHVVCTALSVHVWHGRGAGAAWDTHVRAWGLHACVGAYVQGLHVQGLHVQGLHVQGLLTQQLRVQGLHVQGLHVQGLNAQKLKVELARMQMQPPLSPSLSPGAALS